MADPPVTDVFLGNIAHELHHRFAIGHATIQIERGDDGAPCPQEPAHVV
jgi:hypothetical protein